MKAGWLVAQSLTLVAWAVFVVFWPATSDHSDSDEIFLPKKGDDLYSTTLTEANFGLMQGELFESVGSIKRWKILTQFAELYRKENYAFMKNLSADFFSSKTGNVVTTKSAYGFSYFDKNSVKLEKDVSILSKKGYFFSLNSLFYDGKSHEFSSPDFVRMKGPDVAHPTMLLSGYGLMADIDREHFIIRKKVVSQKKMKNNRWMRITSRVGEFFTDEQRAIFVDHVHSVLPELQLESDIFELNMARGEESMLARGNVVLRNKDRLGYAEKAYLHTGSSRIVLEGKARLMSKSNHVNGKRIVIYSDDDRIEVEQAEGRMDR